MQREPLKATRLPAAQARGVRLSHITEPAGRASFPRQVSPSTWALLLLLSCTLQRTQLSPATRTRNGAQDCWVCWEEGSTLEQQFPCSFPRSTPLPRSRRATCDQGFNTWNHLPPFTTTLWLAEKSGLLDLGHDPFFLTMLLEQPKGNFQLFFFLKESLQHPKLSFLIVLDEAKLPKQSNVTPSVMQKTSSSTHEVVLSFHSITREVRRCWWGGSRWREFSSVLVSVPMIGYLQRPCRRLSSGPALLLNPPQQEETVLARRDRRLERTCWSLIKSLALIQAMTGGRRRGGCTFEKEMGCSTVD